MTNFKAHKKKVTQLGPTASGLIGPAPSIKIEVQTHFDSIWLYPFSWMFSLWLYFYFCQVAIFWLKKVQFSSQKCNFYLWKILHCNFWKNRKEEKLLKTTKMLHYLFTYFVSKTERIFCRLVLISVFPPTYYLLKLRSEWSMQKKVFCSKKLIFPFYHSPPNASKKNREIKRVLNDFVVTYQKTIPPTNLAKNSAM